MHFHRCLPLLRRLANPARACFARALNDRACFARALNDRACFARAFQNGARAVLLLLLVILGAAGCASGPSDGSLNGPGQGGRFLHFIVSVNPNGAIDRTGQGCYAILINAQGEPIEVTDLDTFTDFIRFDGINVDWYHRQANQPNPGFTFTQAGSLNAYTSISEDGKQWRVILDVGEPTNFINQFVVSDRFTAHLVTTDNYQGSILGRILDTMGQGPNLNSNLQQTLLVEKGLGPVTPYPAYYPDDPLNDWITRSTLPTTMPYTNFDIARFEVFTPDR